MLLDPDHCYQALVSHDTRFDGLFFVGVATTGIYCRPVCPARTPRRENCRFFGSAPLAEKAGFRPCRRCRPELAPGSAPVDAVGRLAAAAAGRIAEGALNEMDLEALAAELGTSSRQLRRAFTTAFGVSPVEYALTQRLLLAKRLLTDSTLPVTEVAFASGFASLRRFNAVFRERYHLRPSDLRRSREAPPAETLRFELAYRPPFSWDAMLAYLERRAYAGAEGRAGSRYLRTVSLGGRSGWISAAPVSGRHALQVELSASLIPVVLPVLGRLRHLFDLDAQPDQVEARLGEDPVVGPLVRADPGLRIPGAFDGFELALRAVLGQQVSVTAATNLAGRFARHFGEPIETLHPFLTRLPPAPAAIAAAETEEIAALGVPRARAHCIRSLARAAAEGGLRLTPGESVEETLARLRSLPGIGEWTAQYVALRALRWPDAFPHTDLALRRALGDPGPAEVLRTAEAWRPWRGYAAMHLWRSLEPASRT